MTINLGSLVVDLDATALSSDEREIIAHPLVGGVILFARNYDNKQQLTQLCTAIRVAKRTPLLIMVDQEGGRVQRFVADFSSLPPFSHYGELFDRDPAAACRLAHGNAYTMASELLAAGIDFSISPVLDLNKGMNTVIGNRAFHRDPHVVITLGQYFIEGMQAANMAAIAKHFPGHGSVIHDSHLELPIDGRLMAEIEQDDLLPFQALVASLNGMMMSHLIFPKVDKEIVGFSRYWIQTILRDKLQFTGVILSDDLHMEGANISNYAPDRFLASREAGCDLALYCNDRKSVIQVLDHTSIEKHQVPEEKWRLLKATH